MDTTLRRYLKTSAAATHLNVSKSFLEKRRLSGDGPEYVKMGKNVVYAVEALDAYAVDHVRRSTSEQFAAPTRKRGQTCPRVSLNATSGR
jgi:hypothetical protein